MNGMSSKKRAVITMTRGFLLAAAFMAAGTMTVLADDASQFVSGTKINGVSVGGMTVEQAKVQIEGFYGTAYSLRLEEKGGKEETIKGTEIGYQAVLTDGLQAVLDQQNSTGRAAGPDADNTHTLKSTASYDEGLLAARLDTLECVNGSSVVTTANAYVTPWQEGVPFSIVPEVQGNSVNKEKLAETVKAALNDGIKALNLEGTGCYDAVTVTSEDAGLKAQCDAMNMLREMSITYTFGEKSQVLGGEEICSWVQGMADGVILVDQGKAAAYVQSLASQYDTAGRERVFHTTDGRDLTLKGPYGWQMNQAGETEALIAMIRTGQTQSREPVYSQTAADRNNDWGSTYVEADLAAQHVYMYQDGVLVWDAPCVTGNVSKNYTTPAGIYSLTYKQTDRILRGAKKADGSYEYESHVDYWMPFNGGIGFHDADWRSKFGGTIYQTSGSHGCVNLPPAKAKVLYGLIYKGIPVICHN